jgi:hypothetical protein
MSRGAFFSRERTAASMNGEELLLPFSLLDPSIAVRPSAMVMRTEGRSFLPILTAQLDVGEKPLP